MVPQVFSGLWRLGAPSAAELLGARPDIACYAKLLTGGAGRARGCLTGSWMLPCRGGGGGGGGSTPVQGFRLPVKRLPLVSVRQIQRVREAQSAITKDACALEHRWPAAAGRHAGVQGSV